MWMAMMTIAAVDSCRWQDCLLYKGVVLYREWLLGEYRTEGFSTDLWNMDWKRHPLHSRQMFEISRVANCCSIWFKYDRVDHLEFVRQIIQCFLVFCVRSSREISRTKSVSKQKSRSDLYVMASITIAGTIRQGSLENRWVRKGSKALYAVHLIQIP